MSWVLHYVHLQVEKLRPNEVESLAPGPTAGKQQRHVYLSKPLRPELVNTVIRCFSKRTWLLTKGFTVFWGIWEE
jgi:hypothetical protein